MFNPPEELLQKRHASNVFCLRCCCGKFSVFSSRFNLDVNKRGAKIETKSFLKEENLSPRGKNEKTFHVFSSVRVFTSKKVWELEGKNIDMKDCDWNQW